MTETVVARNQTKRKQVTTGSHHAGSGRQGRKKSQNGHPGRVAILAQELTASRSATSFERGARGIVGVLVGAFVCPRRHDVRGGGDSNASARRKRARRVRELWRGR